MHFWPVDDGFTPVAVNIATPVSSSVKTTVPTLHESVPFTVVAVNAAFDAHITATADNANPANSANTTTGHGAALRPSRRCRPLGMSIFRHDAQR